MYKINFFKRLSDFGFKKVILSWDTLVFIVVFFITYISTNGNIPKSIADSILMPFMEVSASLFAIVLAGLAIVTSFTDKDFIYIWKKIGEFDNMITLFQFNLFIPLIILIYSLFLRFIVYNSIAMILLVSLFAYMIMSLIDLVNFICRYGLQRGEFVKQFKEKEEPTEKKA